MKRSIYFLLNTLATKRGGLPKAVLKRANLLVESSPEEAVIVATLGVQPQLEAIRQEMVANGQLHPGVQVKNLIYSMADVREARKVSLDDYLDALPEDAVYLPDPSRPDPSYRVFQNGQHILDVRGDHAGRLTLVDHFSCSRQRLRRDDYSEAGHLWQSCFYSEESNKITSRQFYHQNGKCYLTVWHRAGTNDWARLFYFPQEGGVTEFTDPADFYTFALERLLKDEECVILFSEFRDKLPNLPKGNLDKVVLDLQARNTKKVAVAHSSHLIAPFDSPERVNRNWGTMISRMGEWDAIVTLTKRQQAHLVASAVPAENCFVIPHYVEAREVEESHVTEKRFTAVSRMHVKKNVPDTILAMRHIVDAHPDAFLDFFGFGYGDEVEKDVLSLVEKLGLEERVRFQGFVGDISEIYRGSVATLSTSISEGFGMAVLESLSYGVPVIAYDILYGPSEIIKDGVNGFLIEKGRVEEFAQAAIRLLENPSLRKEMGSRARQIDAEFRGVAFRRNWLNLLDALAPK